MSSHTVRIAVVEDIKDVREGMRYLLGMEETFQVIKCFESAESLLADLKGGLKPDVILMDIELPGMSGIEATRCISNGFKNIAVLILTIFEEEDKIMKAIRAGARGYVLKNTRPQVLIDQIKSLSTGGSPISPAIAGTILSEIQRTTPPAQKDYHLTARETQILNDIIEGETYRDIATKYNIANSTAKKHILHIYQKLNVKSKVEIVKKAFREGLIQA